MNRKQRRRRILKLRLTVVGTILIIAFILAISISISAVGRGIADKKSSKTERIDKQTPTMKSGQMPSKYLIEMNGISQDGIPTGCEAVSAVTALNYLGVNISPKKFIDRFLEKEPFYYAGNDLYGANPEEKFAGDPYDRFSLGCFPPVIADAIQRMKECGYKRSADINTKILDGKSLEEICKEYVIHNAPVLVWITIDMIEPGKGTSYYFADGTRYTWKSNEHCMVLCGYDEDYYYFKDSLSEGETVKYEKELVELRYEQMGSRALAVFQSQE